MPISARWAISIGILGFLLTRVDIRQAASLLVASDVGFVALAIATAIIARLMTAYRWYVLTRHVAADVKYWYLARLTFSANFIGTFLPGTIGIDAVRAYGLAKTTSSTTLSVSTLIVERVLGLITMMAFVLVGLQFAPPGLPKSLELLAIAGLVIVAAGVALACNRRAVNIATDFMRKHLSSKVYSFVGDYFIYFYAYARSSGLMFISALLAVVMQLLRVIQLYFGACAFSPDIPFFYFLIFAPIVTFIIQIPFSIGGIGVREGAYIFLFGLVGVSSETAFTISIMYFLVGFIAVLPGAAFYASGGLVQSSGDNK